MSLPITTKFGTQEVDCFSHLHGQFQPLTLDMLVTIIFLENGEKMTHGEGKIYSGFRDQEILLATKFDSGYILQ